MPRKNSSQVHINAKLRALILKNFNEVRPLTDDEVGDAFLVWDRARRLFPGLEESLEDLQFALLKSRKIVSQHAIGTEHKQSEVLRYLTTEETASCVANEYKACFLLSLVDAHAIDASKYAMNWYDGQRRHHPKNTAQPSKSKPWKLKTMQFGPI